MKKTKRQRNNLYSRWSDMKQRCYNKKNCNYKYYGARGIKVCDEWLGENGFKNFEKWALQNGYKKELSLDKIDNSGNYSPQNCRWVTQRIQNINKRPSIKNTSGFVGVRKHSDCNEYYGSVKINDKAYYTGMSKDIVIAAIMRNNYIIDNKLDNELNDLSEYKNEYDLTIRFNKRPKIIGVLQYDENMNLINKYKSTSEIAKLFNISTSAIQKCCTNKVKKIKGYIWRYAYDNSN